ncbi:MAG: DUF1015 family protein [Kofleriaceae bacterium]|nr:DUF1015 family protein [Kofleriaceae bacterium]
MPHIAGFRGVLPEPSKVAEVLGAPVDITKGLAAGTLVRDGGRAVYRYHQTFAGPGRAFTRKSFACAVRSSPYAEGMIRPHEETKPADREAALARIRAHRAHVDPVLFGVRDNAGEVDRAFRKVEAARPTLELTTPDGTQHKLWRVQDAEVIGKLRNYFTPLKLHLLEGHASYEAMLAYHDELEARAPLAMYASPNYVLGFIVPFSDAGIVTASRHRIIKGATVTREQALAGASKHFIVDKIAGAAGDVNKLLAALGESVAHQPAFIAVFAGEGDAYKLTLSPEVSPVAEGVSIHRALQKYDPVVVQSMFVERHLPGAQVTTETDAGRALAALKAGASVALLVRPLSLAQIAHVDELAQLLPPHSTALYPALATGLASLVIDPDEDLA